MRNQLIADVARQCIVLLKMLLEGLLRQGKSKRDSTIEKINCIIGDLEWLENLNETNGLLHKTEQRTADPEDGADWGRQTWLQQIPRADTEQHDNLHYDQQGYRSSEGGQSTRLHQTERGRRLRRPIRHLLRLAKTRHKGEGGIHGIVRNQLRRGKERRVHLPNRKPNHADKGRTEHHNKRKKKSYHQTAALFL